MDLDNPYFTDLPEECQRELIGLGLDPSKLIYFGKLWLYGQNTVLIDRSTVSGCGQSYVADSMSTFSKYIAYFLGVGGGLVGHDFRLGYKNMVKRREIMTIGSYERALSVVPGLTITKVDSLIVAEFGGKPFVFQAGIYAGDDAYAMVSAGLLPKIVPFEKFAETLLNYKKVLVGTEFIYSKNKVCDMCGVRVWRRLYYPCLHTFCLRCGIDIIHTCPYCKVTTNKIISNYQK